MFCFLVFCKKNVPRADREEKRQLCTFASVFLSWLISAELQAGYIDLTGLLREQKLGISWSGVTGSQTVISFLI